MDVHTVIVDFQDMSLEKAESQIRTLQHYIQKLRAARNALLPVYRLPLDILLDIFALVGKRWALNLTWVSHHWRELVLRSPSMWTVVTNWNLSRTDELIRRSGSAPLSIRLSNISQKLAEAFERQLESLFAQMPRIQTLHCCQEGWGVHELTLPKLSHALLLSSIKLERVNIHGNFLSQIPNVKDVFLKRCRCSWESDAANFPYLTSLHIIFPYSTVSVGQFTRILHKMPSLELLVVVDAFSLQPDQRVFLPSLALEGPRLHTLKLGLGKDISPSLRFLGYALSSFTTDQTIVLCSANPAVLEEDSLAHLLTTFSQLVSPKQIVSVKGTYPAPGNGFSTLSFNYQEIGQEISRINLDVEIHEQQRIALLSTFRQCLTLTHVKAVRFSNDLYEWEASDLVEVFGGLPNLHYFDIQGADPVFFELLRAMLPINDEGPPPLFPSLKVLGSILDEDVHKLLENVLRKRRDLGYGVQTLVLIPECNEEWKESTLRKLGDLVDHVLREGSGEAGYLEDVFQIRDAESVLWSCFTRVDTDN